MYYTFTSGINSLPSTYRFFVNARAHRISCFDFCPPPSLYLPLLYVFSKFFFFRKGGIRKRSAILLPPLPRGPANQRNFLQLFLLPSRESIKLDKRSIFRSLFLTEKPALFFYPFPRPGAAARFFSRFFHPRFLFWKL